MSLLPMLNFARVALAMIPTVFLLRCNYSEGYLCESRPVDAESTWYTIPEAACNNTEIQRSVSSLNGYGGISHATRCPDEAWLFEWQRTLTPQKPFVYMEIGCNKGTDAVVMLKLFTRNTNVSLQKWLDETSFVSRPACGIDWKGWNSIIDDARHGSLAYSHFCLEPVKENFNVVFNSARDLGYDKMGLHVYQVAISSSDLTSSVKFPSGTSGFESLVILSVNERSSPP
jgi:hypothetical protein